MPCRQITGASPPSYLANAGPLRSGASHKTEAECLQACKEGACCEGTTCSVKPQCQCQGTGKTFKGVGTTCEPNPCLPCTCPANSQPAFPVSMTFRCVVESATAQSSQPCAANYSSTFIDLVNGFSVTSPVACASGGCVASALSLQSGQLSGTPSTPPCDRYIAFSPDTKNDIYNISASLACNGTLGVSLGQFSFQLFRNATQDQYATRCQSLGELGYQIFNIYVPFGGGLNGSGRKLLSVVPPCEGQSPSASTDVLYGAGYLGAFYSPGCNIYQPNVFQGVYPAEGGARFDIAMRIECTLNYANPLP